MCQEVGPVFTGVFCAFLISGTAVFFSIAIAIIVEIWRGME